MTRDELRQRGKDIVALMNRRLRGMKPHFHLPEFVAHYRPEDQELALQAMSDELAAAGAGVEAWDRTTRR